VAKVIITVFCIIEEDEDEEVVDESIILYFPNPDSCAVA